VLGGNRPLRIDHGAALILPTGSLLVEAGRGNVEG
jgi:hypothetical protein